MCSLPNLTLLSISVGNEPKPKTHIGETHIGVSAVKQHCNDYDEPPAYILSVVDGDTCEEIGAAFNPAKIAQRASAYVLELFKSTPQPEPVPQVPDDNMAKEAGFRSLADANNFLFGYEAKVAEEVNALENRSINSHQSVEDAVWYMSRVYLYPGFVDAVNEYKSNQISSSDLRLGWIKRQVELKGRTLTDAWKYQASPQAIEKFLNLKSKRWGNDGDGGSDAQILELLMRIEIENAIRWIKDLDIPWIFPSN